MNELKKLADALGHLCRGADLLAADRGLYERSKDDLPRLDPYVTVTLSSYGAAQIDAEVILHDYTGDGADYRKVLICSAHDACDTDNMNGYEFDKTVDGIYDEVFRDLIGRILDGKLAGAEDETIWEARLPLHLLRNLRTGTLDVVDNDSRVVASFAPDEVVDTETEAPMEANAKGLLRDAAVARLEALLNRIKGNGADSTNDVQMTAEHPTGTPQEEGQEEGPAEAEAEKPRPTRTRRPKTANRED